MGPGSRTEQMKFESCRSCFAAARIVNLERRLAPQCGSTM